MKTIPLKLYWSRKLKLSTKTIIYSIYRTSSLYFSKCGYFDLDDWHFSCSIYRFSTEKWRRNAIGIAGQIQTCIPQWLLCVKHIVHASWNYNLHPELYNSHNRTESLPALFLSLSLSAPIVTTLISVLASSRVSLIKSAWAWHWAVWLWQVGLKFPLLPRWNNATLCGRILMMRCKWHMDVLKEAVEAGCTTNRCETAAGEIRGPSASAERKSRPVDVNWMEEWACLSLGTGEMRQIYHLNRKWSWYWVIEAEYELNLISAHSRRDMQWTGLLCKQ